MASIKLKKMEIVIFLLVTCNTSAFTVAMHGSKALVNTLKLYYYLLEIYENIKNYEIN